MTWKDIKQLFCRHKWRKHIHDVLTFESVPMCFIAGRSVFLVECTKCGVKDEVDV